ncbi:MAG: sugar ABC transporter permease [Proteobacteria bacterium]|nr:sugar ABC transporter permease [Pseudomonadota bacterium]
MNLASRLKQSWRMLTMVFALIAIWIIFQWVTDGAFLQPRNLSNLFRQMTVTGTLAIGMVLIIVAGHIDLSVGSVVCFLGVILTMLMQKGWSAESALMVTLVSGIAISAVQGWLTAFQKVPAFIVTLAGMMIFRGASMGVTEGVTIPLEDSWIKTFGSAYLGQEAGWVLTFVAIVIFASLRVQKYRNSVAHGVSTSGFGSTLAMIVAFSSGVLLFNSTMSRYEGIPYPVLLMIVIMVAFHFIATKTVFGRHVYAVGGSVEAAHLSGVNVRKIVLGNFLLMGLLTTIGAMILTARVESAQPDAGQLLELDAVASCVIGGTSLMGGKGTIYGAILGALVMESLNNGMSLANLESFWQYIVKGVVLVAAVWLDVVSQKSSR